MTRPEAQRRNGYLRSRLFVSTALAALAIAPHARADSAVGISTPLGTQLNPAGNSLYLPNDPMGMSQFFQNSRSPSGLLYPRPLLYPQMVQSQSNPDWWSSGWAEVGYLGTAGDTGAASFREYGDLSAGPVINSAGFLAENRNSAFYLSANMGSVGRSDQTYQLTLGKYGAFSATLFFDSIPHVFSTNAKVLWDGAGTGNLTLPPGLTPGGSTASQVNSVLAALFPGEVSLTREKTGMAFKYMPHELSEVFFRFGYENREGTRPLGATFGYPVFQHGATELVEPIEYRTFDVNAGVRLKAETIQANLTYAGSFFRNDIPALAWENPGLWNVPAGPYIPPQGQMALPPDNDYHTVKGDLAWAFTKGRFAASASYASMKQDAPLLPPTAGSGLINGVTGPIDLANWNTVGALSRDTALAEISTFNGFAQLQFNPTPQLRFDFEIRNRNEDNKTNYVALNPLTGQYGYIALDGGLASLTPILSGVYEPTVAGQRVQIRNIPFATDTLTLTAKAGYRLANRDRIELSYANKSIDYSNREVGDADDHRFSAQFVMRAREWGTTRVSYEFASVSGDTYASNPYVPFNSTSLPGYIPNPSGDAAFTLGPLRKYDIADRTENALKTQTNFILADNVDFQLGGNFRSYDYDADYGLKSARNFNINAELTYQVSLATNFNIFYSFQGHQRDVASINREENGPDDSAGSPNYPLANAWTEEAEDKNHVVGAGLRHQINSVTIDLSYTFTYGDSSLNYSYASPGAFFFDVTPEQAGNAFPENTFRHHLVQTSVLWKYTQNVGVRGYYRFEHEAIEDFHYTGLTQVIDNNIYLATIPESYSAHVFGVFFQYSY